MSQASEEPASPPSFPPPEMATKLSESRSIDVWLL